MTAPNVIWSYAALLAEIAGWQEMMSVADKQLSDMTAAYKTAAQERDAMRSEIAAQKARADAAELREKALLEGTEINRKTTLAHNAEHARQNAAKDAEIARLRAALNKISGGYGPNHLSKYAKDVADATLKGETNQPPPPEPFNFNTSMRKTLEEFENLPKSSKVDYERRVAKRKKDFPDGI